MSAKICLYSGLVPAGGATAVESSTPGVAYVITDIKFLSETDSVGQVLATSPGENPLVDATLQPRRLTGWEGAYVVKFGHAFTMQASPADSIRCIVWGYWLLDIPAETRTGAGSMDAAYAEDGAIQTQDSKLAQITYLMLVELKRIRAILEGTTGMDKGQAAEEVDRELDI